MELHTLNKVVLGGFNNLEIAALQDIAEGHGCSLTGYNGDAAGFLRHIAVVAQLSYGIDSGHEVVDLNLSAVFGLHGLIHAVALYMEVNAVYFAVLGGFDDFGAAVGYLYIQIALNGVADRLGIGNQILPS